MQLTLGWLTEKMRVVSAHDPHPTVRCGRVFRVSCQALCQMWKFEYGEKRIW